MYGVRSIEPSPKLLCPLSVSGEAFRLSGGRTAPVAGTKKKHAESAGVFRRSEEK